MVSPSSKFSPPLGFARRLLAKQWLFVVAAIALFALVWVINWRNADFVAILLYALICGNLAMLAMNWLGRYFSPLRFPYNWLVYLCFLFLVALASSTLAALAIMPVFRIPWASFPSLFWSAGRLGALAIVIVGVIYHLY